jgi:molybdate transport system substrate-binding protein
MVVARASLHSLLVVLTASVIYAGEVHVIASGTLVHALSELIPTFERATQDRVFVAFGPSVASAPDSIQKRLDRGDRADVVIVASDSLQRFITEGRILPETRLEIAHSRIGAVIRAGAPKPDISSTDALRKTLLRANSIAYSSSLSGVYLSTELFPRLGIADALKGKMRRIEDARVAAAVARGNAEIGIQQISELIHVPGVEYVGPLPAAVQKITTISAGIVTNAQHVASANAFVRFLSSPAAVSVMAKHGLDPVRATTGARGTH